MKLSQIRAVNIAVAIIITFAVWCVIGCDQQKGHIDGRSINFTQVSLKTAAFKTGHSIVVPVVLGGLPAPDPGNTRLRKRTDVQPVDFPFFLSMLTFSMP